MAKRKLASVVKIATCEPIPDTERLSVATMEGKGWQVVVGRDEFKKGDLAIYLEIDSFTDANDERYAFLAERCTRRILAKDGTELDKGIRIRTVKLRGVISQGLIMPIDKFPEIKDRIVNKIVGDTNTAMLVNPQHGEDEPLEQELVGADVTSLLKVRHFDEVVEQWAEQSQGSCGVPFDAYGKFPSHLCPKTDEERCLLSGTIVSTDKGLMKIEDIECLVGKIRALSVCEDGNVEFNNIVGFSKADPTDNWLKITLEDGTELTCTTNHKVFSEDKKAFVDASELKVGETLKVGG